jgi:alpha-N-arabinofuranosidase
MAKIKLLIMSALTLTISQASLAQPSPAEVSVTVDTSKAGSVIDRHIYGQFAEHLGNGIY